MKKLIGRPILIDKLNPELGARVVELVKDDMERAERERREKEQRELSR